MVNGTVDPASVSTPVGNGLRWTPGWMHDHHRTLGAIHSLTANPYDPGARPTRRMRGLVRRTGRCSQDRSAKVNLQHLIHHGIAEIVEERFAQLVAELIVQIIARSTQPAAALQ